MRRIWLGDGVARLFFPFPHFGDKIFARFCGRGPHIVAADVLRLELALHDNLCGDTCVVGAGYPCGVEA